MRRKHLFLLTITLLLILPSSLVQAASDGTVASKEEVVYSSLTTTGELNEIYVVNILNVATAGNVTDYGSYTSVKNLTDLSSLEQSGNTISMEAEAGEFYYQGNMDKNQALPWTFAINYRLDGKKVSAAELAGADGHLELSITTTKNDTVDKSFYENYLLQISLTAASDVFKHIQTEEGSIANAGRDYNISWTVMPEKNGSFTLEADVTNFEMAGLEIAALPSSMPIESPDTEEITDDFQSLSDAIGEINGGVGELSIGISELNNGVSELDSGSAQFHTGLSEASGSSSSLVNASQTIDQSLATMSQSIAENTEAIDLSQLEELQQALVELSSGLEEIATGLTELDANYAKSYEALQEAIEQIPDPTVSGSAIEALYQSGANQETIDALVETYEAAQQVKGTYDKVKAAFDAVSPTLSSVSDSLTEMADGTSTMASELATSLESMDISDSFTQLEQGLSQLSSKYGEFHSGLTEYTDGIAQLASAYGELDEGLGELNNGTSELEDGASALHDGTEELEASTSNLPDEIQNEIDAMMEQYDKSDYEPVSFVSEENDHVERVQFVIRSENIEIDEPEEDTSSNTEKEEEKGFWQKLWDLF